MARARPARPGRRPPRAARADDAPRSWRRSVAARAKADDGTSSATCCSSRCPTASPASAGSAPTSGPTRPSSTWACAATCREFDDAPVGRPIGHLRSASSTEQKFIEAVAAVMGRRMETDDARRRDGRGRAPPQRRHQRRHPRPARPLPRPRPRHPDQRERLRRPGRRHRPRRPVHAGRGVHVRRLHVGRGRPAVQPDRARRGTCSAATATCPLVLRSKVAMGTGYGSQHSMDPAGVFATSPGWRIVAPTTPFDYVGLMNTALRCQDPVVVLEHVDLYDASGTRAGRRPRLLPPGGQGRGPAHRLGRHGDHLPGDGALRARGGRGARRRRRRGDRPALARPRQHRLGHHRGEHHEDQPGADRRAGRRRHVVRRVAGRRDPAPVLRPARRARASGSPAARRRRASARCSSARRSPRPTRSSPPSTEMARY